MSSNETEIKLQAYLDGELPAAENSGMKALLERDADANRLFAELSATHLMLAGNEMPRPLPESREFFWSKIEREIECQEAQPAAVRRQSWLEWLHRHLLPVSGGAVVACLIGIIALRMAGSGVQPGEMDVASDDMNSYTFRDQQAKMTMVWLNDRNADDPEAQDASLDDSPDTE